MKIRLEVYSEEQPSEAYPYMIELRTPDKKLPSEKEVEALAKALTEVLPVSTFVDNAVTVVLQTTPTTYFGVYGKSKALQEEVEVMFVSKSSNHFISTVVELYIGQTVWKGGNKV